jgi:D-inositol-3-phosphate glycosyltransferase
MPVRRVAMLSVHTSPLAQPGAGDGGGMNVCVRSMASNLARAGVMCDVFTRCDHAEQPPIVEVESGFRVIHVTAGPCAPISKIEAFELADRFADRALEFMTTSDIDYDLLHANYWISGAVGHRLKHDLDLPLAATFHTLDRVKAEAGAGDDPATRARVEAEVVSCSDLLIASTTEERDQLEALYGAERDRIEIVPPGVDHGIFSPGSQSTARRELGLRPDGKVVLFAGRIQPLKGVDLAVRCLAELRSEASLIVVGGPSGPDGDAELARVHALVDELGLEERVRFVAPQPHDRLAVFYRAADACIVPSRAESFGLVALEAAACGTPVVAADVGGLRSLVDHGRTGFLVRGREPADYAAPLDALLGEPGRAADMGRDAVARSARYTWSIAAARLRRLYGDIATRSPLPCR